MEDRELCVIGISVRELVEFVLRRGDLDNRRTAGAKKEAMLAGSRLHRKIQKSMGSNYQAEVTLKHRIREEGFDLLVEGRADGIITEPAGYTVDEIKCIYMDPGRLEEPDPLHLAQARCYAYIWACDKGCSSMGIQITYCGIETEEIRRFREDCSFEDLDQWFAGLIHEYLKWARYQYHHLLRRQESLKELQFPFPYREGQKALAAAVYRSIEAGRNLFIQAPTGVGKTLSVIFPSLKAMGEGRGDKLFYLTAKTITRMAAQEAFQILRDSQDLYFSVVTITAKEKLCILEKPDCNPESCPAAKGHFDRVNDAVYEILGKERMITREKILEYARRYQVCPFEFCLDISSWVDGIICDYNYVFDPNVRLKRYFSEKTGSQDYLFLVDEAHNLVSRAREMYSAVLVKEDLLLARKILKPLEGTGKLVKLLDRCNRELLAMKRQQEEGEKDYQILEDVNLLSMDLSGMYAQLEAYMNEHLEFKDRDLVLDVYFKVRDFLYIYEKLDEGYRIYQGMNPDGSFQVKLMCINPAPSLKECLDMSLCTLFFSATLLPVGYYKELLTGDTKEYAVYAKSPFLPDHRLILIGDDISSLYRRRSPREYEKAVRYITGILGARKGNYMVFCPSYQYMHQLEGIFQKRQEEGGLEFDWIAQSSRMDEAQREEFLEEFSKTRDKSLAALCVMGGIFSEGIDLKEEKLIGAVIIGTGIPQVNREQEILREYFDSRCGQGFAYAYQYPGMNKVLQAAGRVIRTARDKGVIALLDHRFLNPEYQALFPREWESYVVVNQRNAAEAAADFWRRVTEDP